MIPETSKQVIEPISSQITQRLLSVLGVWQLFRNNLHITADNIKTGNFETADRNQRMIENRCDVIITPNFNPLSPAMDSAMFKDTEIRSATRRWLGGPIGEYPVFADKRTGLYLYEVDVPCSVELDFQLRAKSMETSELINTSIYRKSLTGGSVYDMNEVLYNYPIPDRVLLILHHIFNLQDSLRHEINFQEYLTLGSDSKIKLLMNRHQLEAGDKQLVIERTHSKILGRLDYDGEKPDAENTNKVVDRYLTSFKYTYQFGRPVVLKVDFPIMVNNTLVGTRFIRKQQSMSVGELEEQYHPNQAINNYFMHQNECLDLECCYPMTQYPEYDDWRRLSKTYLNLYKHYMTRFVGLMSVDVDTSGVTSLKVDFENEIFQLLDTETKNAMRAVFGIYDNSHRHRVDLFRRASIFDIAVFADDNMIEHHKLSLSDDLILTVNTTINIEKRYRVVISMIKDVRLLDRYYIYFMLDNPEYYYNFLSYHLTALVEAGYLTIVRDELTGGVNVVRQNRFLDRYSHTAGPHPSITLGRYIVKVQPHTK